VNRRLLFLSPVGFIGGAERVLLECIGQVRIRRPNWEVRLLCLEDGPLVERARELGAVVETLQLPETLAKQGDSNQQAFDRQPATSSGFSKLRRLLGRSLLLPSGLRFVWKLRQAIRRLQPELIHSNGLKSHLLLWLVAPRAIPILWHIHDFYSQRPTIQPWVRRAAKNIRRVFAISQAVADDISKIAVDIPVNVLENCVDTELFSPGETQPTKLDLLAGFESKFDGSRIGIVATYANWKGQDIFLRAIAELSRVRGYIIGGPIYQTQGSQWSESSLRELVTELGIQDRVGFVPFQTDPAWIYRSLDIVVHASVKPEPFGLTIVEAMACGKPVVVSAAGGAKELFTEGWDAIGHEPGSVPSLTSAIQRLIEHPDLCTTLSTKARRTAEERFSQDRFGHKLIQYYEDL
jgi:glycosyltransferase involved in cell wall biosynthesis